VSAFASTGNACRIGLGRKVPQAALAIPPDTLAIMSWGQFRFSLIGQSDWQWPARCACHPVIAKHHGEVAQRQIHHDANMNAEENEQFVSQE
jgi:hypothetical protein